MIEAMNIRVFGEHAILIDWEAKICPEILASLLTVEQSILNQFSDHLIEIVPSYHALAVFLKPHILPSAFIQLLKEKLVILTKNNRTSTRLVTIPVCYDPQFALDIESVCSHCKLNPEELITLHTSAIYKAYFLGFLPGFPYLGTLDEKLETPRLQSPREKVHLIPLK